MWRSDDDAIAALFALIIALTVAAAIAAAIMLQLLLMEAVRVYRSNWSDEKRRRWLTYATLGFLASLVLSLSLALAPATLMLAPWPVALGFLCWVITIELVDIAGQGERGGQVGENLDDVLAPWRWSSEPSTNGHASMPVGSGR